MQSKPDIEVYDEPLLAVNGMSFLSLNVEDSMVQISKDLSMELIAKCQSSMDALDYHAF